VVVDGLNQRESLEQAATPALGANCLFFAADPDFQVATLEDRRAYPQTTSRYRQTVVAAAGAKLRYAVGIFEVRGGLQHDQFVHAAPGSTARWATSLPLATGPPSLLPAAIPFLATARAEDGRWFVQSFGRFHDLTSARALRPAQAWLATRGTPGVRLHIVGDLPATLIAGTTPIASGAKSGADDGRAALVVRRRADDGSTLSSTFVTVFEPVGPSFPPLRVGRVESPVGTLVLLIQSTTETEHLIVNLQPGSQPTVQLSDGRAVRTDGLAVRVAGESLRLAGGTFAETAGHRVRQDRIVGTIRGVGRMGKGRSPGWFEVDGASEELNGLAGRVLLIAHGDGTTRGWTIDHVEPADRSRSLLFVREEPGFALDPRTGAAHYYQFPANEAPAPHHFGVPRIAR
jgi:hypothetical protein